MAHSPESPLSDPDDDQVRCIDCANHCGAMRIPSRRLEGGEVITTWREVRVCKLALGSHPTILRRCPAFKPRFYTAHGK